VHLLENKDVLDEMQSFNVVASSRCSYQCELKVWWYRLQTGGALQSYRGDLMVSRSKCKPEERCSRCSESELLFDRFFVFLALVKREDW
jgi:hypothetical protein